MKSIHISDVQTFKRCRAQWNYTSSLRLGLEPRKFYSPFFLGRAVHAALEAHYGKKGTLIQTAVDFANITEQELRSSGVWAAQEEVFNEQYQLLLGMMNYYTRYTTEPQDMYSDIEFEFKALETEFHIPYEVVLADFFTKQERDVFYMKHPWLFEIGLDNIEFGGRFDALVQHIPTNDVWLWENKTTRSFTNYAEFLDRNEQATFYTWAATYTTHTGPTGVMYNAIRKAFPKMPRVLKNGMLSQALTQLDLPAKDYVNAIRFHHGSLATDEWIKSTYGDTIQGLIEQDTTYVKRFPVRKTQAEVHNFMRDIAYVGAEMVKPDIVTYRSESPMNCQFCMFKGPCSLSKNDADESWVLQQAYRPRIHEEHVLLPLEGLE